MDEDKFQCMNAFEYNISSSVFRGRIEGEVIRGGGGEGCTHEKIVTYIYLRAMFPLFSECYPSHALRRIPPRRHVVVCNIEPAGSLGLRASID